MATIAPNPVGLLFAKRLEVDKQKREVSLIGLFHNRTFAAFPTVPLEVLAFAMATGGRGEGVLQLAFYSLGAGHDYDEGIDWIYRQSKWVKFPDDPSFTVVLEISVKRLIFFTPGEYLFVLTFDGKLVTERRMTIHRGAKS